MIIRAVTVVALVAAAVRVDGDALTDFEAGDFRAELVDDAYKLVSERQRSVLLAGKGSLERKCAAWKSNTCTTNCNVSDMTVIPLSRVTLLQIKAHYGIVMKQTEAFFIISSIAK